MKRDPAHPPTWNDVICSDRFAESNREHVAAAAAVQPGRRAAGTVGKLYIPAALARVRARDIVPTRPALTPLRGRLGVV